MANSRNITKQLCKASADECIIALVCERTVFAGEMHDCLQQTHKWGNKHNKKTKKSKLLKHYQINIRQNEANQREKAPRNLIECLKQ